MGAGVPKALVELEGRSLVERALALSSQCSGTSEVVVVAPTRHLDRVRDLVSASVLPHGVQATTVTGGAARSASVARGLAALSSGIGIVLVHDAARALAPVEVFDRVVAHVRAGHSAVIPVVPVTDTIKAVDALGRVQQTLERSTLRAVQTPQGYLRETLEHAHGVPGGEITDDAGMVERLGGTVSTVSGDPAALKITTAHDLRVAGTFLADHERPGG
ncbi:MAG: 2-C-methyl-D-erythritol 4-phosphate cytidylyltransferase [Ornithinimicrobium sp.]